LSVEQSYLNLWL